MLDAFVLLASVLKPLLFIDAFRKIIFYLDKRFNNAALNDFLYRYIGSSFINKAYLVLMSAWLVTNIISRMLTALDVKYHGAYLVNSLPYNDAIFLLLLLTPLVIYYFLWVHVINPKQIKDKNINR